MAVKLYLFRLCAILFAVLIAFIVAEIVIRIRGKDPAVQSRTIEYFDRSTTYFYPDRERLNPWAENHPDPLRIAVIGDSITAGAGVQRLDTYARRPGPRDSALGIPGPFSGCT